MKTTKEYANGTVTVTISETLVSGNPAGMPVREWVNGRLVGGPLGEVLGEEPTKAEPTLTVEA